jgi:RNA polymerase sigma-70 factor (ECF subfamily)
VEENDLNLVKRARNGDRAAFNDLVERYQRRLYGVCFGILRNHDDALDMVQETFVRAYRSLDRFEGNSSFYTWSYRIARNVCIDHIRKQKRQRTVDYDDTYGGHQEAADGNILPQRLDVDPSRMAQRKELAEQLTLALDTLSPKHREILLLREIEGLAYAEIAELLEISIGTVMSRLFFARKNMQAALADYVGVRAAGDGDDDAETA